LWINEQSGDVNEIRELFHRRMIKLPGLTFPGAGMGTAEWIALALLLIALVGWRRWRGIPEDQKKR
jgi:hypothetical protein